MKSYSSLSIDIIRFEAQDVVTASVVTKCECHDFCFESGQPTRHDEQYINQSCTCTAPNHYWPNT